MKQTDAHYAMEEREALPYKELGNEAYRAKRLENALMHYTRALHCFSIDQITRDKMVQGLLFGLWLWS